MFALKRTKIISDEEFVIEFDRSRLLYKADRYVVALNHEMLPTPKSIAIWRDSSRVVEGDVNRLTEAKRQSIVDDVVRAFRGVGYEVVIVD